MKLRKNIPNSKLLAGVEFLKSHILTVGIFLCLSLVCFRADGVTENKLLLEKANLYIVHESSEPADNAVRMEERLSRNWVRRGGIENESEHPVVPARILFAASFDFFHGFPVFRLGRKMENTPIFFFQNTVLGTLPERAGPGL